MKLSTETVEILKNFSNINQSIQIKEGTVLKTISPLRTIYVEATVAEQFPQEFALYDLNKLLAKMSLYKDADLSFAPDRISIATSDNKKNDNIKYCSSQVIVTPPDKPINFGAADCEFTLEQSDLEWMKKSAGISGSPNFVFESDGDTIHFIATDVKDDSADQSKIEIGAGDDNKFRVVMKVENFKLVDGSYDVKIAKKGLALFAHKTKPIKYFIAIEAAQSTFGD